MPYSNHPGRCKITPCAGCQSFYARKSGTNYLHVRYLVRTLFFAMRVQKTGQKTGQIFLKRAPCGLRRPSGASNCKSATKLLRSRYFGPSTGQCALCGKHPHPNSELYALEPFTTYTTYARCCGGSHTKCNVPEMSDSSSETKILPRLTLLGCYSYASF